MRLSHLAAVATLVALLGAMFVAPGTRAEHAPPALGDVTHNTAQCNEGILQGMANATAAEYDTQVMVYAADSTPDDDSTTEPGLIALESTLCKAENTNTSPSIPAVNDDAYFSITPNGTETPVITKLTPTAAIGVHDSDGIVAAGGDLTVTISLKTIEASASSAVDIEWIRVSGELDDAELVGNVTSDLPVADSKTPAGAAKMATIAIPAGTTAREYTVSARLSYDHDGDGTNTSADPPQSAAKVLTPTATFTVGDPGTNAATAELTLGNAHDEDPLTSANDVVPEDGVEAASDGDVWLKLSVLNSMGKPANAMGLNTITVIAPGAKLSLHPATPAGTPGSAIVSSTQLSGGSNSISVAEGGGVTVGQTTFIKVERAGSPRKPGTVTVYALVIGSDGAPRTENVEVTFTGAGAVVVLGDDVSVGKPAEGSEAKAEISLGADDAGGSSAKLGTVVYSVKDADGKLVSLSKVKAETSTKGSSTEKTTDDGSASVVLVTVDDSAAPGVYTIEASLSGVADSSDTATVTVSGGAASVDLMADKTESDSIGDVITVTATITDEDGHAIANNQDVTFTAAGEGLVQIGTDANADVAGMQSKTMSGQAVAKFTVVGEGTAVVSAVIGSQTAVVVITSTAGVVEEEAMPEEEASVSCLSELSGFATWSCGVEADASAIFDMVTGRGVSAIHLWNGSTWVRYSVVDDAMVPGSSDFMVTENDILYISN